MIGDKDGVRAHNSSTELGWGKEWLLSGNWLSLDTGLSLSIDAMRKAYPSVHVSPRIYLNRRFAIRADLMYSYRRATYNIELNGIKRKYQLPQFLIGSSIEFRL